ncbi:MAG: DUF1848 domain-containing protein [Bacillota bacterium]|nr:DUF1848 domain-containing protein [Bacillota bacterium]
MIISASRRTDIPSYYSEWFCNRIREGYVLVRNPMNIHQISKISLSPDVVDGIVFWTKNSMPMLDKLSMLKNYMYYFQFTVTSYGNDVETNSPSKKDEIIPAFQRLSDMVGPDRVIWRYDPIMISEKYSVDYHLRAFEKIAKSLNKYTKKCTISFIDKDYRGVKNNIKSLNLLEFTTEAQMQLAKSLVKIANSFGLYMDTCAEKIDLHQFGIEHARCIDDRLFEKLVGCPLNVKKDKSQRIECGCVASIDIGMYNTCRNGCKYCYANYSQKSVKTNSDKHNPLSPLLSGDVGEGDIIRERIVKSCCDRQIRLFDI